MNKTEFKKTVAVMADDLYDKGFRAGVNSCKDLALIKVEEADGSIGWSIRLGDSIIEIPQAILDSLVSPPLIDLGPSRTAPDLHQRGYHEVS